MRKSFILTVVSIALAASLANAEPSVAAQPVRKNVVVELASPFSAKIETRTKLRKDPHRKGLVYRYLEKGEEVKVLGGRGSWAKVESKWHVKPGKPKIGYVSVADLPQDVAEKVGLNVAAKPSNGGSGGSSNAVTQQPSTRMVTITLPQSAVDVKAIEAARDSAVAQVKVLEEENVKLKEQVARHAGELKAVQTALATTESRLQQTEADRQKLATALKTNEEQLASVQGQLQSISGGAGKLMLMADNGEAVFFKGLGEALMATSDGRTVLRFPLSAAGKADKIFMGAKAERHLQGGFAYYFVDSNLLVF